LWRLCGAPVAPEPGVGSGVVVLLCGACVAPEQRVGRMCRLHENEGSLRRKESKPLPNSAYIGKHQDIGAIQGRASRNKRRVRPSLRSDRYSRAFFASGENFGELTFRKPLPNREYLTPHKLRLYFISRHTTLQRSCVALLVDRRQPHAASSEHERCECGHLLTFMGDC
jgi:hypothetical protein